MASGMKQVETNSYDVQRLLHVKGKRNVVAGEVGIGPGPGAWPPVSPPSLGGGQRPRRGEGREEAGKSRGLWQVSEWRLQLPSGVPGGGVLEEFQPWGCFSPGPWEGYHPVERAGEQPHGETQGKRCPCTAPLPSPTCPSPTSHTRQTSATPNLPPRPQAPLG